MITTLVLIMMLLTEVIHVYTKGNIGQNGFQSRFRQVLFSALLGLVPGCIGGFAVVSLFTHEMVSIGALFACMVASTGDESFVMLSIMPSTALFLDLLLLVLAIGGGWMVNFLFKKYTFSLPGKIHMEVHTHDTEIFRFSRDKIISHIRELSFTRCLLIIGLFLFIFGLVNGQFNYHTLTLGRPTKELASSADPENILFIALALIVFYVLLIAEEHFLQEHLWKHIIKKHFLRIFLWTFGALAGVHLLLYSVNLYPWLEHYKLYVMFLAILVGLIPESGPHLIFVTLFFSGIFPFSILMTNSIVQDGHISLPLLAESRKSFMMIKALKVIIGLIVGISGYWMGW